MDGLISYASRAGDISRKVANAALHALVLCWRALAPHMPTYIHAYTHTPKQKHSRTNARTTAFIGTAGARVRATIFFYYPHTAVIISR